MVSGFHDDKMWNPSFSGLHAATLFLPSHAASLPPCYHFRDLRLVIRYSRLKSLRVKRLWFKKKEILLQSRLLSVLTVLMM